MSYTFFEKWPDINVEKMRSVMFVDKINTNAEYFFFKIVLSRRHPWLSWLMIRNLLGTRLHLYSPNMWKYGWLPMSDAKVADPKRACANANTISNEKKRKEQQQQHIFTQSWCVELKVNFFLSIYMNRFTWKMQLHTTQTKRLNIFNVTNCAANILSVEICISPC